MMFVTGVKDRLLKRYGSEIAAIGIYGSLGRQTDGPYSDIEIHVVTRDDAEVPGHEIICLPIKIEIDVSTVSEFFRRAGRSDDAWAVKAGAFAAVTALHDPENLFEAVRRIPLAVPDEDMRNTMRQFMIWEPYETMGKIRNAQVSGNWNHLTTAAVDLVWQTAKLIGLANRKYFSTRARTLEEAAGMASVPAGFAELAAAVISGELTDKDRVYRLCENLWTGLNDWFATLGIDYLRTELPF